MSTGIFQHCIKVHSKAVPHRHKVRNVPLSYRKKRKEMLDDMCKKKIIEPIVIPVGFASGDFG